jgi:HPt (histidine-containing phosphotransfer) domain-containing protein
MTQHDAATPPIDVERLRTVTGDNTSFENELLIDFRDSTRTDADELRKALQEHDAKALARAAHRIKGASWVVGAIPLADACDKIESAGRAADWPAIDAEIPVFESEMTRLCTVLDPLQAP